MSGMWADCSEATRRLLDDPRLTVDDQGFFIDLDVAALAAEISGVEPSPALITQASNLLGKWYKWGYIVRFGPVRFPEVARPDFARIASRIVVAGPDIKEFPTPNGVFKAVSIEEMPLQRGRHVGLNRDDRQPWGEQQLREIAARALLPRP